MGFVSLLSRVRRRGRESDCDVLVIMPWHNTMFACIQRHESEAIRFCNRKKECRTQEFIIHFVRRSIVEHVLWFLLKSVDNVGCVQWYQRLVRRSLSCASEILEGGLLFLTGLNVQPVVSVFLADYKRTGSSDIVQQTSAYMEFPWQWQARLRQSCDTAYYLTGICSRTRPPPYECIWP